MVEQRHDVVVIDQDKEVCEGLASQTGVLAVCGGATDIDVLEQGGINKADVAVATMQKDADNLSFSLLAKSFNVPQIIARMRDPRYSSAYEQGGVTATVHIVDVFVNQLLLGIEDPHLRQVATFGGGKASIVVDTIPEGAVISGKTVSELAAAPDFPAECVITGIYRVDTQEFLIPRGPARIQSGDRVFLVAEHSNLRKASKFLHRTR